jgi:hypothetical protein
VKRSLALLFIIFFLENHLLNGQLKVGGDPHQIHPYALLELESKEKALLLPRMSEEERDASFTQDLPEGLLLFNTDSQQMELF